MSINNKYPQTNPSVIEQYLFNALCLSCVGLLYCQTYGFTIVIPVLCVTVPGGFLITFLMRLDRKAEQKRQDEYKQKEEHKRLLESVLMGNFNILVSRSILHEINQNEYESLNSRLFHSQHFPEIFSLANENDLPTLFKRGHLEIDNLGQIKYGDYISENGVISIRVYSSITKKSQLRLISGE